MTAVRVCLLAFVSVKILNTFKETSGHFPAVFFATKLVALNETLEHFQLCLYRPNRYFKLNHNAFLTLTKWALCLNLNQSIRTVLWQGRYRHIEPKGPQKNKVSTYLWFCRNILCSHLFWRLGCFISLDWSPDFTVTAQHSPCLALSCVSPCLLVWLCQCVLFEWLSLLLSLRSWPLFISCTFLKNCVLVVTEQHKA